MSEGRGGRKVMEVAMTEVRPDPDRLLKQVEEEEKKQSRGTLKIFFGYAAGVGKTCAMLQSAHMAMESGTDVVCGYIEPHARPETLALLSGLTMLPVLEVPYKNITLREFDLDGALKRHPALILVDELAHTNAEGTRHRKRYQDIEELLKNGIDVYTTVNVQHIESLNDIVASITGVIVQERIPDFVFDGADQVELVDIEPAELMERLREGKIYRKPQAGKAMDNFFTAENLTALREIALRRTADQVNRVTERAKERNKDSEFYTGEHILICLSPSPSNARVIRAAARMANAFRARFTSVYVEDPSKDGMEDDDAQRLRANLRLAEQLGATAVTLYGENIVDQIAEYARISGVSKIVLGRSYTKKKAFTQMESFSDQLLRLVPNMEVYLIPDAYEKKYQGAGRKKKPMRTADLTEIAKDFIRMAVILLLATVVALIFRHYNFDESNIVTIYMFAVLLIGFLTVSMAYSLIGALAGVLLFNFFFTAPYFTFKFEDPGYAVTFFVMFLSGTAMSFLAKRAKNYGKQATKKAYRMEVLLETSRKLQAAAGEKEIIEELCRQLVKLLHKDIVYYRENPAGGSPALRFPRKEDSHIEALLSHEEMAVAAWCYKNCKHAGATTNTLPGANGLYLAVRNRDKAYGVVGICIGKTPLTAFDEGILSAMLSEGALALEKEENNKEKNQAVVQMKQEQLRANLLRSISHDLRTPLTGISGNAAVLLENSARMSVEEKREIYESIYDDSAWLINMVENLLSVTRIENGSMTLKLQPELLDDVIKEALVHIKRRKNGHDISVETESGVLMAWMDPGLIVQVFINLLDNAIKYTPEGSRIVIGVKKRSSRIIIEIKDEGNGISDEAKKKIFDLFYTCGRPGADTGRNMGIGLALCKSVAEAHGGTIEVSDNKPKGTVFRFDLKAVEVR